MTTTPSTDAPFGPVLKDGFEPIPQTAFAVMERFITHGGWFHNDAPATTTFPQRNPKVVEKKPYGAFMLAFDFHLTPDGPKLIEINTNAGCLVSIAELMRRQNLGSEAAALEERFIASLLLEYHKAKGSQATPRTIVILDDAPTTQFLFAEMRYFADLLTRHGFQSFVLAPEDLTLKADGLYFGTKKVDLIYNRCTDFLLEENAHKDLCYAYIYDLVALTPNPQAYIRIAAKDRLLELDDAVTLKSALLATRSIDEWTKERKKWVFKPSRGYSSKGVYRGDKISLAKLQALEPTTLVQEYAPPSLSADGSKVDIRIFTYEREILAICCRHFAGQVLEMRSDKAGYRLVKIF